MPPPKPHPVKALLKSNTTFKTFSPYTCQKVKKKKTTTMNVWGPATFGTSGGLQITT